MLIRVDEKGSERIEGFAYENQNGDIESVCFFRENIVYVNINTYDPVQVYIKDIPNLILALQAAYDHWKD